MEEDKKKKEQGKIQNVFFDGTLQRSDPKGTPYVGFRVEVTCENPSDSYAIFHLRVSR